MPEKEELVEVAHTGDTMKKLFLLKQEKGKQHDDGVLDRALRMKAIYGKSTTCGTNSAVAAGTYCTFNRFQPFVCSDASNKVGPANKPTMAKTGKPYE